MNLLDVIDGKTEADETAQTSERIRTLIGEGLGLFERAFGLKYLWIMVERQRRAEVECDETTRHDHSPEEPPDGLLHRRPGNESDAGAGGEGSAGEGVDRAYLDRHRDLPEGAPLEYVLSLVQISEMGELMDGMSESEERGMNDALGIKIGEMAKILPHLHEIQGRCSSDQDQSRTQEPEFCLGKFAGPSEVAIIVDGETESLNLNESLFGTITLLRHMLSDLPYKGIYHLAREWGSKVAVQLSRMPQTVLAEMNFPDKWMDHRIWQGAKANPITEINDSCGRACGYNYKSLMRSYDALNDDDRAEVDRRTRVIREKLVERGWDTEDSRMDSCEWTARACVMKSVAGIEDEGHGFPAHEFDLAKALADGSDDDDDLLNALNDFHAERTDNDCVWVCIPKGASDETILEKIDRWMEFDLKRRESAFDESVHLNSDLERQCGSIITIKNISPLDMLSLLPPFFDEIQDLLSGRENPVPLSDGSETDSPETTRASRGVQDIGKNLLRMSGACRHALMTRIGESGIVRIAYRADLEPWPQEIVVDLDKADPDFRAEIEDEYKLRDPEKVGCGPYDASFRYPFMLENDLEAALLEKVPTQNPFGSVDNALFFSSRYYAGVLKKKLRKNIVFSQLVGYRFELNCTELVAKGPGKFEATFHLFFDMGDILHSEWDFVAPIEVEEVNGEFHLNIKKMQMRCSRDVESVTKKIARKISKMDV